MALFKGTKVDPQSFILKKQYDKAVQIYLEILEKKPDDVNSRLRLADVYALAGQIDKAVVSYKKAADLFAEKGFLLKAIGVNKKIVKLDPAQKDVHLKLSKQYEEKGLLRQPSMPSARRPDTEAPRAPGATPSPVPAAPPVMAAASPEIAVEEMPIDVTVEELAVALAYNDSERRPAPAPARREVPSALEAEDLAMDELPSVFGAAPGPPARTPLFSDMTAEELAEVMSTMSQLAFGAGEAIVREGDRGDSLFVIVEGKVGVFTEQVGGTALRLATLQDGDFFGEVSLLTGKPRTATITAEEPTEVLELSKPQLDAIAAQYPRVREVLQKFYKDRVQSTIKMVLEAQRRK